MMSNFNSFVRYFFHAISKIQSIVYGLFVWFVVNAAAIAYFEARPEHKPKKPTPQFKH
jgi:hypothetical protein